MSGKQKKIFFSILFIVACIVICSPVQVQAASKKPVVTKLTLNKRQYVLKKGEKLKLKAAVLASGKKSGVVLKWKSSNKKVVSVNSKGVVKAKSKKGRAKITVMAGRKKASCNITVGVPIAKVKASDLDLFVGKSTKLKTSISPKKASIKKLSYKSSVPEIVSVDAKGNVTAKKQGSARITITAADRNKIKKTIKVTVRGKDSDTYKNPKINIAGFSDVKSNDVTAETVTVTGTAEAYSAAIKKITYSLRYEKDKKNSVTGTAKGTTNWKISNLPLKIGTNLLTITAVDSNNHTATKTITFHRLSTKIEITVNDFSSTESNNVDKEKITVTGTAVSNTAKISKVSYSLKYAMDNQASVTGMANGTSNWKIENLPLQVGTNFLTITAEDANRQSMVKEIVFNRISTEIQLSENVVLFDEEKNMEISNDIVDYWQDDRGTEDPSDDLVNLLFYENAELVQSLKDNRIKIGDVVMLQPSEALYMGFNGVVMSYGNPSDSKKYPANEYEVISFRAADYTDMFEGDISLSYEIADVENPLAFAYFPTDVEIASLDDFGQKDAVLYASEGYGDQSEEQQIDRAGFQKNAVSYMMNDAFRITGGTDITAGEEDTYGLNVGITFKDTVFYDKDGKSSTKNDQFKIGGKISYENLKVKAGIERHSDILPQQIMGKYTYKTNVDMHAEWTWDAASMDGGNDNGLDLSDFVKDANKVLNHEFENNKQFLGVTLSGIDMSDSIILGMFGLQISPVGINPVVGIKNTQYASIFNSLSAIIVIIPVLDVTGEITAKAGFTYQYSAYHENGINMQKKGFVGAYGSLEDNKGQSSIDLPFDRSLEIYDVCARSSSEKDADPGWSTVLSGKGEAVEEIAFGADIGLMFAGIIPAVVKARIYEKAEVKASGEIKVGNGLDVFEGSNDKEEKNKVSVKAEGKINANLYVGLKPGAYFNLAIKTALTEHEFPAKKEWNYDFCQITVASVSGTVVKEAGSTDDKHYEALEDVKVRLQRKSERMGGRSNELPIEVYSDADGNFLFPNIKDGEYELVFSIDGYTPYTKEFTMEGENQEFQICLEPAGFQNALKELISEQGIFKENQSGTMQKWNDVWFDPSGIISAKILDFDSDDEDEMLVCYTKQASDYYQIYMDMYELVDGKVVLADSMLFSAYDSAYGTVWDTMLDMESFCSLNAVKLNKTWLLMCEEDGEWCAFRDEMPQNYWLLSYQNNQFQYEGSLTGVEGVFFGFTGHEFRNGKLVSSRLYYGEEYGEETGQTPLYDEFPAAAENFFGKFGIYLTDDVDLIRDVELGSILSNKNNKESIFEFTNKLMREDDNSFEFKALLKRDEMLEKEQ